MSDYTKIVNYAAKDSLIEGDPNKIIKGTELDAEFVAVSNSIETKADSNSPTFTGIPRGPTASYGTDSTQLATTAFVQQALQAIYPVGSIYINASSSTNPATLLGFGTWSAFGEGKVLIGLDASDTLFDVLEETGGSKDAVTVAHTHTFTTGNESASHTHSGTTGSESQGHTHTVSGSTGAGGAHNHTLYDPGHTHSVPSGGSISSTIRYETSGASYSASQTTGASSTNITIAGAADHTHSITGTTSGVSQNHTHSITTGTESSTHTHSGTTTSTGVVATNANIQPYIVVKMWKRTA